MSYKTLFDGRVLPRITIVESGCWENSYAGDDKGYKNVHARPLRISAHRLSYLAHFGEIPLGMSVLHKCDNPGCCNPDHLFVGTQADNMRDMDKKGRRNNWHPFGERNPAKTDSARKKISQSAKNRKRGYRGRFIKESE